VTQGEFMAAPQRTAMKNDIRYFAGM
jgi:hypothetical protein